MIKSGDGELRDLAREELEELKKRKTALEDELKFMLLPKDPRDDRNVILEIRGGTGGEEAALFAASLFRMYSKYAEARRWKIEVIDSNPTGLGGLKEIVASIIGKGAYNRLKYESGVHRVAACSCNRSIRPHPYLGCHCCSTSRSRRSGYEGRGEGLADRYLLRLRQAARALILRIQQSASHICQPIRLCSARTRGLRSKNREKAMKVLRSRLYELEIEKKDKERAQDRKSQVGTGDRSERIRTYNYPQNRVTDHRIGLTLHKLEQVLEGAALDEMIDSLNTHFQAEKLKEL